MKAGYRCWMCGEWDESACDYVHCPQKRVEKMHDRKLEDLDKEFYPSPARMNQADYFAFHEKFCADALALSKKKNNDYAGSGGTQPFANFERVEALGICATEVGFLTRLTDKLCRINTFVQDGVLQVSDESVRDTLIDVVNYAVLLAAYIEDKRGQGT